MKRCKVTGTLALGLLCLVLGSAAQAQVTLPTRDNLLPIKGTREINVAGNFGFDNPNAFTFNALYGYFTSPALEVGGQVGFAGAKHESTATTYAAFADYHFVGSASPTNPLLPFVGVVAGGGSSPDLGFIYGIRGGVKYFLNPNVALTATIQYTHYSKVVDVGGNGQNHATNLLLGFSTFFR